MKLSNNFSSEEFACKCGCGLGLREGDVSLVLVQALQELRDLVDLPIHINSGLRCEAHNKAIHGSPHSQHLLGKAADVTCSDMQKLNDLIDHVSSFRQGGVCRYYKANFSHLDVRGTRTRWYEN